MSTTKRNLKLIRERADNLRRGLENPSPEDYAWCYMVGALVRQFNEAMAGEKS